VGPGEKGHEKGILQHDLSGLIPTFTAMMMIHLATLFQENARKKEKKKGRT
jgi:hypothetical protein